MSGEDLPLSSVQVATIDAIVSVFETGRVRGAYAALTFSEGDKGQLTYGKHQTTLASGNLAILLARYVDKASGPIVDALGPYVARMKARDRRLNYDSYLKNLLRAAADDPLMRSVQDDFFSEVYQARAFADAARLGLREPLSWCLRYDGQVHGSWAKVAAETSAQTGRLTPQNEREWMTNYVAVRRHFLASGSGDLPKTVYRMDAIRALIDADTWGLELPLIVRDEEISELTLAGPLPGVFDGPAPGSRDIRVATPIQAGRDVRLVQLALSHPGNGFEIAADGRYGSVSAGIVTQFQRGRGLPASGIVDRATLDALSP